jgi:hypothetical protein
LFFGTKDKNSKTPLYVIAGYKKSFHRQFYMASKKNDGVFDLKAVLDLGGRKVSGQRIFPGLGHMDLFKSKEVIQQVNDWIQQNKTKGEVK